MGCVFHKLSKTMGVKIYLFILEKESMRAGMGELGGEERIPSGLLLSSEPDMGLDPTTLRP